MRCYTDMITCAKQRVMMQLERLEDLWEKMHRLGMSDEAGADEDADGAPLPPFPHARTLTAARGRAVPADTPSPSRCTN